MDFVVLGEHEVVADAKSVSIDIKREQDTIKLVFDLTGGEGFIAGGFARYCVSPSQEPVIPNDIDVFCYNEETFDRIIKVIKASPNIVSASDTQIESKFRYKMKSGFRKDEYNIQIIKPVHIANMVATGDFENVLKNFDFTIAKCAILPDGKAFAHPDFYDDELAKQLIITNIHCPISSMKRVIKYAQRGYNIESIELLKLFKDYEARSADWKDIVTRGLSDDFLDEEERDRFVQTMYFD